MFMYQQPLTYLKIHLTVIEDTFYWHLNSKRWMEQWWGVHKSDLNYCNTYLNQASSTYVYINQLVDCDYCMHVCHYVFLTSDNLENAQSKV